MPQHKEKLQKKLPKRAGRRRDFEFKRAVQHEKAARRLAARVAANAAREQHNAELRAQGLPTPWEISKARRLAKRTAA